MKKCPICGTTFGLRSDGMCLMHSVSFARWKAGKGAATEHMSKGQQIDVYNMAMSAIAIVGITAEEKCS